jgi:hypothetical protein
MMAGCNAPPAGGGSTTQNATGGTAANRNANSTANNNRNINANTSGNVNQNVNAPAATGGRITYRLPSGELFRIEARDGATPENLTAALDRLASGNDNWLNTSANGEWLVLDTERFDPDCAGFACLAVVTGALASPESVRADGQVIHPDGFGAITSAGDAIVFPSAGGPHNLDLWITRRSGGAWSAPQLLSGASPYAFNAQPSISNDGRLVVFDCGPVQYAGEGTAICQVGMDNTGFRVVLTPANAPPGLSERGALHSPSVAPDGSIVFEGDWDGERVWRLPAGASVPVRVGTDFPNDNSPCVLPDGRVVSLWLDRPGGPGVHEIKVMTADASNFFVLQTGVDVADTGIGCGE